MSNFKNTKKLSEKFDNSTYIVYISLSYSSEQSISSKYTT